MRADRLLTMLQMLQEANSLTAQEMSRALGVSVRTVYRDMDSMCRMGVPVTATAGPNGGYSVLPGYRSVLSGFSSDEIGVLMAAAAAADLRELGMDEVLKTAIVKLGAYRRDQQRVVAVDPDRVLLDNTPWETHDRSPVLEKLIAAIAAHRMVSVELAALPHQVPFEFDIEPVGVVHKSGDWHLVYRAGTHRVIPVDAIRAIRPADMRFSPDPDFSLQVFWRRWCDEEAQHRRWFRATLAIRAASLDVVEAHIGGADSRVLSGAVPAGDDLGVRDEVQREFGFTSFEDARSTILGLGSAARVLSPEALRLSVVDFARETEAANIAPGPDAGPGHHVRRDGP